MATQADTAWIVNTSKDDLMKIDLNKKMIIDSSDVGHNLTGLCILPDNYIIGCNRWDNGERANIVVIRGNKVIAFIPLQYGSMPSQIITIPGTNLVAFAEFGANSVYVFSFQEFLTQLKPQTPGPAVRFRDIIKSNLKDYEPADLTIDSKFASIVYPDSNAVLFIESDNSRLIYLPEEPLSASFNNNQTRLIVVTDKGTVYQIDVEPASENRFNIVNTSKQLADSNVVITDARLIQDGNNIHSVYSTKDSLAGGFSLYSPIHYTFYQDTLVQGSKSAVAVNDTTLCTAGTDKQGQGFVEVYNLSAEFGCREGPIATIQVGKNPSDLCFVDGQRLFVATGDGLYLVDVNSRTSQPVPLATLAYPVQLGPTPNKALLIATFSNQTVGAIDIKDLTLRGQVYVPGLISTLPIYGSEDSILTVTQQNDEYRFRMIGLSEIVSPVSEPKIYTYQNNPNPFGGQTAFCIELSHNAKEVTINICNIRGQLVKNLEFGRLNAGIHNLNWDGRNDQGEKVASGVYFAQLRVNGKPIKVIKIVAIKGWSNQGEQAVPESAGMVIFVVFPYAISCDASSSFVFRFVKFLDL